MDLAWMQVLNANTNIAGFVLQTFELFGAMATTSTLPPADITLETCPGLVDKILVMAALTVAPPDHNILAARSTFIQA